MNRGEEDIGDRRRPSASFRRSESTRSNLVRVSVVVRHESMEDGERGIGRAGGHGGERGWVIVGSSEIRRGRNRRKLEAPSLLGSVGAAVFC